MAQRIECVGYGVPCPVHAWWYHEGPGRPFKRCPVCRERRRWREPVHASHCAECGAPIAQSGRGRPRLRCEECSPIQLDLGVSRTRAAREMVIP
jgi:hypothetical protein